MLEGSKGFRRCPYLKYLCQIVLGLPAVLAEGVDAARVGDPLLLGYFAMQVGQLPPNLVHLVVQVLRNDENISVGFYGLFRRLNVELTFSCFLFILLNLWKLALFRSSDDSALLSVLPVRLRVLLARLLLAAPSTSSSSAPPPAPSGPPPPPPPPPPPAPLSSVVSVDVDVELLFGDDDDADFFLVPAGDGVAVAFSI